MAVFETWMENDLKKPVKVRPLSGNLFSMDNGGNLIGVVVTDDGKAASLSGGVTGYVIRDDGYTVPITGTLKGNKASIILSASCYEITGPISIVIKVGSTTVGACSGYVYRSRTDAIIDPAHEIPDISDLLKEIAAMRTATANANTATEAANTATGKANTAAETANKAASNANEKAGAANTAASNANEKAGLANEAANNANTKAGQANTAAETANKAAAKIDNMTVGAEGVSPGTAPSAEISEVSGHKHIHFMLEKGDKGDTGAVPDIAIGTVSTLETGEPATASMTGTQENPILNLGLPKGNTGDTGAIIRRNITWQKSTRGDEIPEGAWQSEIPIVGSGEYLWMRAINTWNNGTTTTDYSVSRMGIDGDGAGMPIPVADVRQMVAETFDSDQEIEPGEEAGDEA